MQFDAAHAGTGTDGFDRTDGSGSQVDRCQHAISILGAQVGILFQRPGQLERGRSNRDGGTEEDVGVHPTG